MIKKFASRSISLFLTLTVISCYHDSNSDFDSRFTQLDANETGITFSNDIKDKKELSIFQYANFYGGAGVGIGDFNNDGLQDIFFAGNMSPSKLYFNKGEMKFEDVTSQTGIINDGGWSTGVTLADVNNDGNLDIYVSRELYDTKPEWRTNQLYINLGDGKFQEKAEEWGVANDSRTRHATFLDYDKDGLLDLFLLTQPPNPGNFSEYKGTELLRPEHTLKLYKNTGSAFVDMTQVSGLQRTGFPNAVSASDINNDGWTDLYVANDFYAPDFLFLNNQDGTFTEIAEEALGHMSYYSMGVDVADVNNDGQLDVFVLDMVAEDNFRMKSNMSGMDRKAFWNVHDRGGHYQYMYNTVQLNNGNTTFSDVAQFTGMSATDWSWANLLADFDNDGHKDAFVTNGLLRDIRNTDADKAVGQYVLDTANKWIKDNPNGGEISIWDILDLEAALEILPSQPLKNYAFKNKGGLEFEKVTQEWGLDIESFSNGAAYGDLDNDGDLDLVVNNINSMAFVYRNNTVQMDDSNFFRVHLEDSDNKNTFGTRITVYCNNQRQLVETTNVRGIYSTSETAAHFGLGKNKKVDSVHVVWPNNKISVFYNVMANQTIIAKKENAIDEKPGKKNEKTLFTDITDSLALGLKHQENEFDDFEVQVLLPHKLSQFGPAMAVSDVNGDNLDDIFFGGATGQPAKLYLQKDNGTFVSTSEELWNKEAPYEDVDAIFFDVNSDGYDDLFVVSGGNEYPANDFHYTDRIYLNDKKGNFRKGALLNADRTSGSTVKIMDYDNDGDLDVFVGGRHVPHQYPAPATSSLYVNENGQLLNKTKELAEDLIGLGMVTDAVWIDYDDDGDKDLMVVGEWMPITLFSNTDGFLSKADIKEFEKTRGWWFGLDKGDFDGDGDDDFLVGNLGLNYKYKTAPEAPFDIFYKDFDNNGAGDIVLGYYNDGKHYPLRGFSCSSEQIPVLKKEFKKYDVFAALDIEQAYGEENLKDALHYETDTFASYYIENQNGNFELTRLPNAAQLTNLNDFLVRDFDHDGHLDALGIGNLHVSEIETPRSDAGVGLFLKGDGQGGFKCIPSSISGFFAPNDAKKINLVEIKGRLHCVVGNNNNKAQFFEIY